MDNNIVEFNTKVDHDYGVEQITSLEGALQIRRRPGMYIGSTSSPGGGLTTMVREAVDNSIDEFTAGFGDTIDVLIKKDSTVRVIDHGRGMPVGPHPQWKNPDGTPMNTLTGLVTKLHAGGKFGGDSGYVNSAGLHGIGIKCCNFLSTIFIVTVKRDGKIYQQKFEKGIEVTGVEVIGECDKNDTGTTIEYRPDSEIFKHGITPSCSLLQSKFDEVTSLNTGLKIIYNNEITGVSREFYHETGIRSYVKTLCGDRKLLFEEPFYFNKSIMVEEVNKVVNCEVAFIYDDEEKPNELFKTFANNVNTAEGGYHLTGCRDGLRKELNKFIIDNNISKKEVELRYLVDGIVCVISVKLSEAEFEGQTKGKLASEEAKVAMISAFELAFAEFVKDRKEDLQLIADRAIRVKAAEEAARKARQNARAANKAAKMALPGKLIDCSNKTGYRELFLVDFGRQ